MITQWDDRVRTVEYEGPNPLSGPIKFGSNWAGVFIRGDVAAGLADQLRLIASQSIDIFSKELTDLAGKLEQSRERNG